MKQTHATTDQLDERTGIAERAVTMVERCDGTLLLRDPRQFTPARWTLIDRLRHWSDAATDRTMLASRCRDGDWVTLSYGEMRRQTDAIAQALLDLGLRYGDSVLILSGNSVEHAAMALGTMTIGAVAVPVSPAYSLAAGNLDRLRAVARIAAPKLLFVQDGRRFERALDIPDFKDLPVVVVENAPTNRPSLAYHDLIATTAGAAVETALATVGPDTIAKLLFTSGSTGWPKGVPNTHAMMSASVEMADAVLGGAREGVHDETLCWLPWNHTMAGNVVFNINLHHGESYYLDDGRPMVGEYDRTIHNWRGRSPRFHRDVPAGFAMLADALEADGGFRQTFFARLAYLLYAGASMPEAICARFQAMALATVGRHIPFFSGYGATEASPGVLQLYWPSDDIRNVGIPLPGLEVKLVPLGDGRHEVRVRGPNVMKGYVGEPGLNLTAFDDEGFYKLGDTVRFVDPGDPIEGLCFAGRLSEDFKLLTGTFVSVGSLRLSLLDALAPLALDAVITGHDDHFVGALIWPNIASVRSLLGDAVANLEDAELAKAPAVAAALSSRIDGYNRENPASSKRIERFIVLDIPPSLEANEITDKNYINQRAALASRSNAVAALYGPVPGVGVHFCEIPNNRMKL